jgi:hypothetical protein
MMVISFFMHTHQSSIPIQYNTFFEFSKKVALSHYLNACIKSMDRSNSPCQRRTQRANKRVSYVEQLEDESDDNDSSSPGPPRHVLKKAKLTRTCSEAKRDRVSYNQEYSSDVSVCASDSDYDEHDHEETVMKKTQRRPTEKPSVTTKASKSTPKKQAKAAIKTPKAILKLSEKKIKAATERECKTLLTFLLSAHPEILLGAMETFHPMRMPSAPLPDDPLLQACFHCQDQGTTTGLSEYHGVKVCASCSDCLHQHGGSLTRDRVMSFFHFTKGEADKIPRQQKQGGFYKSLIYVYQVSANYTFQLVAVVD